MASGFRVEALGFFRGLGLRGSGFWDFRGFLGRERSKVGRMGFRIWVVVKIRVPFWVP